MNEPNGQRQCSLCGESLHNHNCLLLPKRYMLFCCNDYYRLDARSQVQGYYDTLDEAEAAGKATSYDRCDVLDLETGEWVA